MVVPPFKKCVCTAEHAQSKFDMTTKLLLSTDVRELHLAHGPRVLAHGPRVSVRRLYSPERRRLICSKCKKEWHTMTIES